MSRHLATLFLAVAIAQASAPMHAQDTPRAQTAQSVTRPQSTPRTAAATTHPAQTAGHVTPAQPPPETPVAPEPVPAPAPQIIVTAPPAAPSAWTWHDRVLWGANIVLVILGYVGVLLALKTLKHIQKQTDFGVTAAQAALQCANAALESSQAIVDSGRPWIVITVEPFMTVENGFKVMATNRGRTPARITATADRVKIAPDETKLPPTPDYGSGKSSIQFEPIILLPGESAGIRPVRRADLRALCSSDDEYRKIEKWDQKLFIYGRVTYRDMISPLDQPSHETDWCCWYVFGDRDALVLAGPPEYNQHK
jgi:hypothetical protein